MDEIFLVRDLEIFQRRDQNTSKHPQKKKDVMSVIDMTLVTVNPFR